MPKCWINSEQIEELCYQLHCYDHRSLRRTLVRSIILPANWDIQWSGYWDITISYPNILFLIPLTIHHSPPDSHRDITHLHESFQILFFFTITDSPNAIIKPFWIFWNWLPGTKHNRRCWIWHLFFLIKSFYCLRFFTWLGINNFINREQAAKNRITTTTR